MKIQTGAIDTLYISNESYTVLNLEIQLSTSLGFILESSTDQILRPGDEVTMKIFFVPTETIDYEGMIFIISEAGTDTVYLRGTGTSVGIEDDSYALPDKITLFQNYPNPFNPTTRIKFELTGYNHAKLSIYDMNGKLVQTLLNEEMPAGTHEIEWNAVDVASGVYIYSLETGNTTLTKKLLLLK